DDAAQSKEPGGNKQDDMAKKKEPFRDRAFDKALEYIKGELKKEKTDARAPITPAPTAVRAIRKVFGAAAPGLAETQSTTSTAVASVSIAAHRLGIRLV